MFSFLSYLISFQRYSRLLYYAKIVGSDDVIRCDNIWKSKHKIENISASNTAMKLKLGEHVIA